MLRDTLKTLKNVFGSVKERERKENEEIKRHSCHFSEATGSLARARRSPFDVICLVVLAAVYRQAGPQHKDVLRVMQVIRNP